MTRLLYFADPKEITPKPVDGEIPVWLFGNNPPFPHAGAVGGQVIDTASRFAVRPDQSVMDLLAIAMAVAAADTFVSRAESPTRWGRTFELHVPLCNPSIWMPIKPLLEKALLYLSGDEWHFEFRSGGVEAPTRAEIHRKINTFDLSKIDCVSLFSGGLDSSLGALELLQGRRRPLLVSHAAQGDAGYQERMAARLASHCQRLAVNTYPTWSGVHEDSTRTRSFGFIALAALAGQCASQFRGGRRIDLFVCENGLIALNPPLTPRRIGSLSTRTAHPYFLGQVQELLDATGISVQLINPYEHETKGEMLGRHSADDGIEDFAAATVSCGKWKRKNKQCGRCVPCAIRRASFHAAALPDQTDYQFPDLRLVVRDENGRDDLLSIKAAISRQEGAKINRWVLQAGPLPSDPLKRQGYFDVARRGIDELSQFLIHKGV